jgi:hypothetical protein
MAVLCRFADTTASERLFQLFTAVNERGVPVPRCPKPTGTPVTVEVAMEFRRTLGAPGRDTKVIIARWEVDEHAVSFSDRSLVERCPSEVPGGRSAPADPDLAAEVVALAELLAEMAGLARDNAVFPSRWAQVAELALEHESVRAALRADSPPLSAQHIITQLNELRDLIGDGHARR